VDGRRSYVNLAQTLGVPQRTVRNRVAELRETGVIFITAVADPRVLGYRTVAMLGIRVRGRAPSTVARDLTSIGAIDYVILSSGRFDIFAEVFCRSVGELRDVVEGAIRVVDGVDEVEVFPYLRLHYQEGAFGVPEHATALTGVPSDVPTDRMDHALAAELSADGRAPLQRVAERLGTSEAQIRRRLGKLQRTGALRVMAITNPMSLGFEAIAQLGITVSAGTSMTAIADALSRVEAISYVALCIGRFDIFAEAVCVDSEELESVIDDAVRSIPGVDRCEAFLFLGLHYKPLRPATLWSMAEGRDGDAGRD
jgi:DNA-binding Lrp family transcriptional regulator